MTSHDMASRVENERILVLERVFDAPRERLFEMFKDPEHLKQWWGPRGWELPVCTVDFRPGGVWHYCMKCVDQNQGKFFGMESWAKAVYKEIIEPEKIRYTDYFSDAAGRIDESLPATEITLEFIDLGEKTKLISRAEYVSAEALKTVMNMGMLQGITETWDRLSEHVASMNQASAASMISQIGQIMLYVDNQDTAKEFWTEKLGFTVISEGSSQGIRWIEVAPAHAGTSLVLHDKKAIAKMEPELNLGTPSLMFYSKNLDKLYTDLKNSNVTLGAIVNTPSGRVFNFADSENNYFAVMEKNE